MEYRVIDIRDNEDVTFKNGDNYFVTPHGDLMYYDDFGGGFCDTPEYFKIVPLSKQVVAKQNTEGNATRVTTRQTFHCPKCNALIYGRSHIEWFDDESGELVKTANYPIGDKVKFCYNCGQSLDWE